MRIGQLDERVIIQTRTITQGTSGEKISTWQTWKTIWAEVKTSRGDEKFFSPQLTAEATHKILIRFIVDVVPTMRLLWRDRYLDITYVDESRRRKGELWLLCKEQVTP